MFYNICGLIWSIIVSLLLYGTWQSKKHFILKNTTTTTIYKSISILKPLKGIDSGLEENLIRFFQLDYPQFELLFSVADPQDPVIPLVTNLIKKYPHVSAKLNITKTIRDKNINPKIHNMLDIYTLSSYEWILISDSNIRIEPCYLHDLNVQMVNQKSILTSAVVVEGINSFGAWLESSFLLNLFIRAMVIANKLQQPCVIGKSIFLHKKLIEDCGGFVFLQQFLAEDDVLGRYADKKNYKIILSQQPVYQYLGDYNITTFFNRHIRWNRTRKVQAPLIHYLEPLLSNSWISGLVGGIFFNNFFNISIYQFMLFNSCLWFICDVLLQRFVNIRLPIFHNLFFWILKEIIVVPLWCYSILGNKVNWRDNILFVNKKGKLV